MDIQSLPKSRRLQMMIHANVEQFQERRPQAGMPTQIDNDKCNPPLLQRLDHRCKLDQFRTGAETDKNLGRFRVYYLDHNYK